VVAARRTAVGSFQGSLSKIPASTLGTEVIKQLIKDTNINPDLVDEVIVGQVLTANCGQNPARIAALNAGLPHKVPCLTINKVCGSGMKSLHLGSQAIQLGEADVIIAGGQENMSLAPHYLPGDKSRGGQRMGPISVADGMLLDGLTCAFNKYHMGVTAENVASQFKISRADQDAFSLNSQQKATRAQAEGRFKKQIVPITTKTGVFETDEYIKPKASLESLQKLNPAFMKENGTVTAGNASGINDGAAMMLLMSEEKAKELKLPILAYIKGFASAGVDPKIMGTGPIPATRKLLKKVQWDHSDVDLIESNEAFASQALTVQRELGLDPEKINVNGGSISIGHPIGCSGARISIDLIYEMQRQQKEKGLATMCIGGGMGVSIAFQRTNATASKL